jgi:hypothetical protein
MDVEKALIHLQALYERLGHMQSGDDQVMIGKQFSKVDLLSSLDEIAAILIDIQSVNNKAAVYIREHQGVLSLNVITQLK